MKYQEFLTQIQRRQIKPVYFLNGGEELLVEEAITRLKKALLTPGFEDLNYHLLYGPSSKPAEIIHLCQTLPVLSSHRLVVVKELESLPGSEALISYLDYPSASTCLVLAAGKVDQRKRIFPALRARTVEVLVSAFSDAQLTAWIKETSRSMGFTLNTEAVDYLKERLGHDLYQIRSEFEKIFLMKVGDEEVEVTGLEALVAAAGTHSAFEWLDAVRRGDAERAIEVLERLLDSGEHPLSVLGLLLSHVRRAAREDKRQTRPGSPLTIDLVKTITLCLEADSRLKGSKLSPQTVMEDLTLKLCGKDGSLTDKRPFNPWSQGVDVPFG